MLFVHFANLKRDMPRRRCAASRRSWRSPIDEARWAAILEYCSFDWMKRNATKSVPLAGAFWDAGAEVFINKGVNGRWRDTLTAADVGGVRGARGRRARARVRSLARDRRVSEVK